jgi:hypothetical protein
MKRKRAWSNYDTKQCKNGTTQRKDFKATITLFRLKECWHKTSKAKKSSIINRWSSPLNQAVKGLFSQT